jgi:hypothetical protein
VYCSVYVTVIHKTLALRLTFLHLQSAHGKRSGSAATDETPDDGAEAVAAIAAPEDARWFLSKLVRQAEPSSRSKVWQRLKGVRVPSATDRRHREAQWKNSPMEEEADTAGENDSVPRQV